MTPLNEVSEMTAHSLRGLLAWGMLCCAAYCFAEETPAPVAEDTFLRVRENDAGEILKFVAWFATGDNSGFPVSIYEVTEANPDVTIELPGA